MGYWTGNGGSGDLVTYYWQLGRRATLSVSDFSLPSLHHHFRTMYGCSRLLLCGADVQAAANRGSLFLI